VITVVTESANKTPVNQSFQTFYGVTDLPATLGVPPSNSVGGQIVTVKGE